jgi:3-oxoadipate enol-lactonase
MGKAVRPGLRREESGSLLIPRRWCPGIGKVGAVGARADGAVEVYGQKGVVGADAKEGLADGARDGGSGPFGDGAGPAVAAPEADRTGELAADEVAFCFGSGDAVGVAQGGRTWSWVKAHDARGEEFAAQQLTWLFSTVFLRNREAVQQTLGLLASNPNPVAPDAYHRQAQAYLEYDAVDRLGDIKAPTLVVVGEQDLLTPPWVVREVASKIPGARFEVIRGDGASHVVPIERPDDFNPLVARFLGANP